MKIKSQYVVILLMFALGNDPVLQAQYRQWTTYTTADGLADNDVFAMVEDRQGALWFGTFSGGVSR